MTHRQQKAILDYRLDGNLEQLYNVTEACIILITQNCTI